MFGLGRLRRLAIGSPPDAVAVAHGAQFDIVGWVMAGDPAVAVAPGA